MISNIIESLAGTIECLDLFEKIYPLVEQKETEGRTELGYYKGKGQLETITRFDNFNGVAYFRLVNDIDISKTENPNKACADLLIVKYIIRFVCAIRRDRLPVDCAFSDEEFAWIVAKEITGRGGALKSNLGASKVYILANKISTDRKKILNEELPGNKLTDLNYEMTYLSIDFSIDIEIQKSCIGLICDTYYTTITSECTPRIFCRTSSGGIARHELTIVSNQYAYVLTDFIGYDLLLLQSPFIQERSQWSWDSVTGTFTVTDSLIPMTSTTEINLFFQ